MSHFSANADKVMSWTETTASISQNDTLATLIDLRISTLKGHILRLRVPGFPFSVSNQVLTFLKFQKHTSKISYVARLSALNSTGSVLLLLCGCMKG